MMKATDFGNLHDRADLRSVDRAPVWRILLEREVSSSAVVIREVAGQDAAEVSLAEHEDMVETLAPYRADEPFREGILPRAAGGREDLPDPHALHPFSAGVAVAMS